MVEKGLNPVFGLYSMIAGMTVAVILHHPHAESPTALHRIYHGARRVYCQPQAGGPRLQRRGYRHSDGQKRAARAGGDLGAVRHA